MAWDEARRRKAAETKAAKREARQATATPTSGPKEDAGDLGALLAGLGAAIQKEGVNKQERARAIEQVEGLIGQLDPKDYPELAKSPAMQAFLEVLAEHKAESAPATDPPGTIYRDKNGIAVSKKPWTLRDCYEQYLLVEFTPLESKLVLFAGVPWYFVAEETVRVPKIFVDTYLESRRQTRVAYEHAQYLFKKGDRLSDPTVLTPVTARVRASGDGGWFEPGGGGIAGPGPQMEEGGEGGEA